MARISPVLIFWTTTAPPSASLPSSDLPSRPFVRRSWMTFASAFSAVAWREMSTVSSTLSPGFGTVM
jgi:hypothetical protein